jgi:hypothetical protein
MDGLGQLQDAAGGFPVLVVAAADEQDAAVVVGDDAADADRVPGRRSVHVITSRVAYWARHVDKFGVFRWPETAY